MTRLIRRSSVAQFLPIAIGLLGLIATSASVQAEHPRPFKGAFDFAVVDIQPISLTEVVVSGVLEGKETHLGRFEGVVVYVVDLNTGTFFGNASKFGANGDRLDETLTGYFTLTGSEGDFLISGGTGRFLNATGGGDYVNVWTDETMTAGQVTFDGTIVFDASNRRK